MALKYKKTMIIISAISYIIAALLSLRLLYVFFIIKESIESIGIVIGCIVALATGFYSIHSANAALRSAERFATIQTRPYIYLEGMNFKVYDDMRNETDKHCEYELLLKNSGNIPASDVSMDLDVYFKNKEGNIFELSTYKTGKDIVCIPSDKKPFVIATGDLSRIRTGLLWINKEDADPIANGSKAVGFNIIITYSAPSYSNRWTYAINGELLAGKFLIKDEKIK